MDSLATLTAKVIYQNPDATPLELLNEVLDKIEPQDHVEHITTALQQYYIPRVLSSKRRTALAQIDRGSESAKSPQVTSKVARLAQSNVWNNLLRQRILLNGSYIFLAEATAEDLRAQARKNWAQANSNIAMANRWNKYADVIEKLGVTTFGEVTPEQAVETGIL